MLWDIHTYSRTQWDKATQGDWSAKEKPIFKNPSDLKYFMTDHYSHKNPMLRFVILSEPAMDEDYGHPMRRVLAMAEFQQYPGDGPHEWSMPFISISPSMQNSGVARELFRHALATLKQNDPNVVLKRTANSPTGIHWQHVADTELFAAKIPWMQGQRSADNDTHPRGNVHMTDFDSPTARMVDALQRKSAQDVGRLLAEHPGHDWSAPNEAFVHPLKAALQHLPDAVPGLLEAGAKPSVDTGWIGYSLIDDHKAFKAWLDCFEEADQGKAFVVAVTGHRHFLNEHPVWNSLSEESKQGAKALVAESGTFTMRGLLADQPAYSDDAWEKNQWSEFAEVLEVRSSPAPTFSPV